MRWVRALSRRDEGVAMITVVLVSMVLTTLVVSTVGYSVISQNLSRRDQDSNAALAAAQAGVDDYMYRLQQNDNFEQKSSSNLPASPNDTPFRSTTWQTVPGTTNGSKFHYDASLANAVVTLTSTGRVRNAERTVRVTIRRRAFLDYLYFTNYEVLDPLTGVYDSAATATTKCSKYWWQGRPTGNDSVNSPSCSRISFAEGDEINGPLHSNDMISVTGDVEFNGAVTTSVDASDPAASGIPSCSPARIWWNTDASSGCGTPDDGMPQFQSGDPRHAAILQLPQTNSELATEAGSTGCLYNGPTRIVLKSTGKMDVTSNFTTNSTIAAKCVGTNKNLPSVIYVQNVPSSQTSPSCPASSDANLLGYPINNDITQYSCRVGDVFLSGVLNGRLSIAAENDIVIVDDTTYQNGTSNPTDMLGLIANRFVKVYHPISCSSGDQETNEGIRLCKSGRGTNLSDSRNSRGVFTDAKIHAAILALNHSFIVQNWRNGDQLGTLTVYGAIGQAWRGTVATGGGTGYLKDYNYDARMQYESPPYFIDPLESPWRMRSLADIPNPRRCTSTITTACIPA
jgi:hypothetical protein